MKEGEKTVQGETSISPFWYLCWLEVRVSFALRDGETKDMQIHSWAREFRRHSQGWNVLASHLASLASFETELSVSLANNGESNALHYLWFQHALKAPPAAGLRTLWGLYWLQAAQLAPLPGHFHSHARKCLCPLNSPALIPFTDCSAHHPRSGLERRSFPMIFQATLEDNARIAGRFLFFQTF